MTKHVRMLSIIVTFFLFWEIDQKSRREEDERKNVKKIGCVLSQKSIFYTMFFCYQDKD